MRFFTKHDLKAVAKLSIGVLLLCGISRGHAAELSTDYLTFNDSAKPASWACSLKATINYQLPDPAKFPGPKYPVFMFTPGTYTTIDSSFVKLFTDGMAARGYLAAAVDYPNFSPADGCTTTSQNKGGYLDKAQCIYDTEKNPRSAIATLCALPHADCSLGVVTAGHSQGAAMAILAANYAPQVVATYGLSSGDYKDNDAVSLPCMDGTKIANEGHLTLINGVADGIFGGQSNLQGVTGLTCAAGSTQCWSPSGNGAGWYNVQNSQVEDGTAGHCYFLKGAKSDVAGGCIGTGYDPTWLNGTENWSLNPNLDWLATHAAHRNFSQDGQ